MYNIILVPLENCLENSQGHVASSEQNQSLNSALSSNFMFFRVLIHFVSLVSYV